MKLAGRIATVIVVTLGVLGGLLITSPSPGKASTVRADDQLVGVKMTNRLVLKGAENRKLNLLRFDGFYMPQNQVAEQLTYGDVYQNYTKYGVLLSYDTFPIGTRKYDMLAIMQVVINQFNGVLTKQEALDQLATMPRPIISLDEGELTPEDLLDQLSVGYYEGPNELPVRPDDHYARLLDVSVDIQGLAEKFKQPVTFGPPPEFPQGGAFQYEIPEFTAPVYENDGVTQIDYQKPDGSQLAPSRTVRGSTHNPAVTIESPDVAGYIPDQKRVSVDFKQSRVVVTYRPVTVVDQSSLVADDHATINRGASISAATFRAKATDAIGKAIPVRVDASQADVQTPGDYPVLLSAANGRQKTVKLTVLADQGVIAKQQAVYATKTLYLYETPTFTANRRIVKYQRTKRVDRPMFVVTGQAYSKNGVLRYHVREVTPSSRALGRKGYITARPDFVTQVYYQKKVRKIKVINPSGVNAYRRVNLTRKTTHYKRGAQLKVVGIQRHNLTTRFVLANGQFVTANKKLVIALNDN